MDWKQLLNQSICGHESDSVIFTAKTNVKHLNSFLIFQLFCIVTADKSPEPSCHMNKAKGKNANKKKVNVNL